MIQINPFVWEKIDGLQYPSTGWVLNDYFNSPQEILAVLGAVGDQEENVKDNEVIIGILKKNDLSFSQVQEIVRNIDSSYIINDERQIKKYVNLLSRDKIYFNKLLKNKELLGNRKKIDIEINTIVEGEYEKDDGRQIIYKKYQSDLHIISNVTRDLSKKFPNYLIVVINDSEDEETNIYFRNKRGLNLIPIIDLAHKCGYNSGGKKEVAGVVLPDKYVSNFLLEAVSILDI